MHRRTPQRLLRQWPRRALVALMAMSGLAAHGAPAPAPTDATIAKLNEGYAAVESAARAIPRDSFDPQAVIERSGRDERKLFEFVRDQTYWVPYRGALRGPVGVLQDRVGSSLDRALLLAELLRASGFEVRLAHATLDEVQAVELARQLRPVPSGWRSLTTDAPSASPATDAERQSLDRAAARTAAAAVRAADLNKRLSPLLSVPVSEAATDKARAVDALKDHWWVQRKNGADWLDLDPTLPSAAPGGAAVAKPDKTLPALAADGKLTLPAEFCHEIDVKVIVERWDAGKTTEAVAVSTTVRPADVLDRRVAFDNIPIAWPKKLADHRPEPKDFTAAIRGTVEWMPVIYVSGASITDKSVTIAGDLVDHPKLDAAAQMGQAVGGMFGGALGGGGDKPKAPASHLTAEWLQYTIRAPGRAPVTVRREVFDLLGPAAREEAGAVPAPTIDDKLKLDRGLSLLAQTEILVLNCQPTSEFVAYGHLKRMLGTRQSLQRGLIASGGKLRPRDLIDRTAIGFNPLWYVALNRAQLTPSGRDVYLDTANVFQYRTRQVAGATDAEPLTRSELVDLAYNAVAVRQGADRPAFTVRVEQGVADTVAEAFPFDGGGKTAVANTAWLFALGNNPAPTKDLPATGFSTDAAARVRQTTAAGRLALLTPAPAQVGAVAHVGWWQVDPVTGDTVGVIDNGFHAAMTEREQLEAKVNALLRVPFDVTLEGVKDYSQAEFIDMILAGKNLSGLQMLRAFQTAARLYEMILAL